MWKIVICDTDPADCEKLKAQTEAYFSQEACSVRICSSAEQMVGEAERGVFPDIAILDVWIGQDSGIKLAKRLFPENSGTAVIFIAESTEYCTEVYETPHVYFLVKPAAQQKLESALEKAVHAGMHHSYFAVHTNTGFRKIDLAEIRFIESSYRKLYIHTADEIIPFYGSFAADGGQFGSGFLQCHKSFMVNLNQIHSLNQNGFLLDSGETVPISQKRYADSKRKFLEFLGRHSQAAGGER